jgi:hypothetical protein
MRLCALSLVLALAAAGAAHGQYYQPGFAPPGSAAANLGRPPVIQEFRSGGCGGNPLAAPGGYPPYAGGSNGNGYHAANGNGHGGGYTNGNGAGGYVPGANPFAGGAVPPTPFYQPLLPPPPNGDDGDDLVLTRGGFRIRLEIRRRRPIFYQPPPFPQPPPYFVRDRDPRFRLSLDAQLGGRQRFYTSPFARGGYCPGGYCPGGFCP